MSDETWQKSLLFTDEEKKRSDDLGALGEGVGRGEVCVCGGGVAEGREVGVWGGGRTAWQDGDTKTNCYWNDVTMENGATATGITESPTLDSVKRLQFDRGTATNVIALEYGSLSVVTPIVHYLAN